MQHTGLTRRSLLPDHASVCKFLPVVFLATRAIDTVLCFIHSANDDRPTL